MERPSPPQLIVAFAALALLSASLVGYLTRTTDNTGSDGPHNRITIADFAYGPDAIRVSVGETVTWSNDDDFAHTVTSDVEGPLDSGEIVGGGAYKNTFDAVGSFEYVCTIHPSMRGTVEVEVG